MADLRGMARADPSAHLATNTVGREKAAVPRIAQVHWSNLRSTVQEGQMTSRRPVARSQTRTVRSLPPETIRAPSGVTATADTGPLWPSSVRSR
jgi:hypothetical protein